MSIYANPSNDSAAGVQSYVQALLDLVGDRDPLALLPGGPAQLAEAIGALAEARLRRREREGKWSVAHVVQHLADAELMLSVRYRLILAHDRPPIIAYDQDAFAEHLHYETGDVQEALETFRVVRRANVRLLGALTPEERKRGGLHSDRGFEDVERLMTMHAAHDIVHLRQIARILNGATG